MSESEVNFRIEHTYGDPVLEPSRIAIRQPIEDEGLQHLIKSDLIIAKFACGIEFKIVKPRLADAEPLSC